MRQKEQKQQNYYSLLSNIHNYALRKTINKSKINIHKAHNSNAQQKTRLKTILPMITDKKSQLFSEDNRERLKTEQHKPMISIGLVSLNSSVHQYRSVINTDEKRLRTRDGLQDVKERIVQQYKTECFQEKLKKEANQQQFTLGQKIDSRQKIVRTYPLKEQTSERSFIVQNIEESKQKFIASIQTLPKSVKHKNEENLSKPLKYLQLFNPFFHRNNKTTNLCVLKIGRIMCLKSSLLYKRGEDQPYFYLILLGKVKLQNGNLIKYCQTGQCLKEQIIFSTNQKKISLQKAKVIGKAYLLQIQISQWFKLTSKMLLHGFKNEIRQSEALIKRNYITKNWLRNKAKKQSQI